jgi:formylglycine-generating enzyme required for sulfatase activity
MRCATRRLIGLSLLLVPLSLSAHAGERYALVVGIEDYQALGKLKTCRADAKAVAKVLVEHCGFPKDNVILLTDDQAERKNVPSWGTLQAALRQMTTLPGEGDTVLIFFSGHGVTVKGDGYLVPLDGDGTGGVKLSWLKGRLAQCKAATKLLVLDACHAGSAAKGVGGIAPDLAKVGGFVMLLSCRAEQVSYPEADGGHSVFTRHLVAGLSGAADANDDKTITHDELYGYVRKQVVKWCIASRKTQIPVLFGKPPRPLRLARPPDPPRPEDPTAYTKWPFDKAEAKRRQQKTAKALGVPVEKTVDLGGGVKLGLVLIPAGEFKMGSTESDDEKPVHTVRIKKPFYMGKTEVTRSQFAAFVQATNHRTTAEKEGWAYTWDGKRWGKKKGASWRDAGFTQTDSHPVVNVSWDDATALAAWVGRRSGATVTLPTEAEWEYASRSGTESAFPWGDDPDDGKGWCNAADQTVKKQFANWTVFRWSDGYTVTAPVGRFRANGFGLYDMHGNVLEWCQDWYDEDYYKASPKEDPPGAGSGKYRVLRGGSWGSYPWICRSAYRDRFYPPSRRDNVGVRLCVRDVR